MDKTLSQLIRISNTVGKDSSLVQGVGGNTSVKTSDGEHMYIKASGTALKDMSAKKGWRRLGINAVREIFADKPLAAMDVNSRELKMVKHLQSACDDNIKSDVRPSVESPLHVILDKCVIHLHALAVLSYASAKNGKARIFELFEKEEFPPLWVPYADPGFSLGVKAFNLVSKYKRQYGRNPSIMVLEKHGLLVAADTPDKTLRLVRKVIKRCKSGLTKPGATANIKIKKQDTDRIERSISKALLITGGKKLKVSYFASKTVSAILRRSDVKELVKSPPLTPDEMGFVASPIMWLENIEHQNLINKIVSSIRKGKKIPAAFLVSGVGLFVVGNAKMTAIVGDIVAASLFIRSNAQDMGGINGLNRRQRDFIDSWEAEKFRIQLASK